MHKNQREEQKSRKKISCEENKEKIISRNKWSMVSNALCWSNKKGLSNSMYISYQGGDHNFIKCCK